MFALTIIQLSYTSFSLVAYTVMIFLLISIRKNFKTFSTLLITSSIINVIGCLNVLVQSRLIRDPVFFVYYEWHKSAVYGFPFYLRLFHFKWFTTGWELQYACTFLTTFNRFTAIVMFERHEKIWRFSPLIITVGLVVVVAPAIPSRASIGTYTYRPAHNDYSLDNSANIDGLGYSLTRMLLCSTLFIIISTTMILLSVRKVGKMVNKSASVGRIERNLNIISFISFGAMILNYISFLIMVTWQMFFPRVQALQDFLDIFYPICSDIFCLSLPYYTLLLRGPVNSEMMRRLGRGNHPSRTTSIAVPTMTNIA